MCALSIALEKLKLGHTDDIAYINELTFLEQKRLLKDYVNLDRYMEDLYGPSNLVLRCPQCEKDCRPQRFHPDYDESRYVVIQ
jgi:hypothetical protein